MSLQNESQFSPQKRRRDSFSGADPKRIKRQHPASQRSHNNDVGPSISELKSKIRDIKRLLARKSDDLPADARIFKERELAGCQRDLEKAELKKQKSKMIQKYHFVRFLERKRATKELRRLETQKQKVENDGKQDANTKQKLLHDIITNIESTRIDLNYTMYSPLTEKYISLYPNKRRKAEPPEPEESNIIHTNSGEKPPLWYAVKQSMSDGTLELLRDGKLGVGLSGEKKNDGTTSKTHTVDLLMRSKKKSTTEFESKPDENVHAERRHIVKSTQKKRSDGKKGQAPRSDTNRADDSGSDSDGGFFE
ncbi:18S rRNA maturation protein [Ophidiomyces ophidiicola]|uniref:18S rRNA maturation protein n=1 Tax=Ophidiomyces ophidiicola TaxID=1387563 RepID=UPI0020C1BA30|nr:18S rRNA maturation protein [Ophidiomyces ophidiicola]KAI1949766.1 18S rRNA maturation protein [Ophidiomyces ophidiicola]KAI1979581.1 18S rRNA maturation protein [Ophidiomyces ophidiicola]KAI1982058.1 18S rRNA maturation protein [Ophidiomyces ophidiicola]KAI1986139.1 18S rRNA maturation protein [Ophidiomyces ophidiicola]KAI1986584.1 18S rRNA maturation protein [Ophidiomyces ophidiicola]